MHFAWVKVSNHVKRPDVKLNFMYRSTLLLTFVYFPSFSEESSKFAVNQTRIPTIVYSNYEKEDSFDESF